jgi:DNA-binding CsgD family transcriptional regulator/tetratricopeptide (TPR) repeat protein
MSHRAFGSYALDVTVDPPVDGRRPARVRAELVGRDSVLALAERRWAEACDGRGRMLLLAGEAGIGKSRMLDEIAERVEVPIVTTRAWPKDAEFPGAVLVDLARALRHEGRHELADAIAARVRDETAGDAARRYRHLVADLAELVAEVFASEPTLLRIEDLHWADELSLDVLERVAPLVQLAPALVVATFRSDEVPPGSRLAAWRSRLLGQRFAEEARLEPLGPADSARLAESLLGDVPAATLLETLVSRSNGIPLYLEELVAAGGGDIVPETIAEAVRQRAAVLPAEVHALADAAAAIGCSFEFALFLEIVGGTEDEVERGLGELCAHQLLARLSDTKYDYRHALLRDALYDEIPPSRRRRLHAQVAEASERAGIRPSYLSEQYELAGLSDRAFAHAVDSARAASRISAHREAAELYARALRTAPTDLAPRERAALIAESATERAAIDDIAAAAKGFAEAIELLRASGDAEGAVRLVADLMAMRHLLGDGLEQRIALAHEARGWLEHVSGGGDDATWGRLLGAEAAAYMLARRLDESIETGTAALARLARDRDPAARLDVQATLGAVQVFAGQTEGWQLLEAVIREAGTEYEAAAGRARRMIATSASVLVEYPTATRWLDEGLEFTAATERWNDHNYLRAHRAHVRWATGAPGAERDALRALADGRGITTEIEAHKVLGYLELGRGHLDLARERLEHSLALGRRMDELQRVSPALWGLAEAALHGGEVDEAIALVEEGYRASADVDDAAYLFPFVLTGVRAHLARRDLDGAAEWFDRSSALVRRRAIPGTLPALDHAEGVLRLAERRTNLARPLLDAAHAEWSARGRVWEGTQVLFDLGRCAALARRVGEASGLVAEGRRHADESGAPLLARLAASIRTDAAGDPAMGPLTAREFEVAELVASGATNREIAERLVISPKTVSAHLEHMLAKLGMSRRSEIAAWVSRMTADQ